MTQSRPELLVDTITIRLHGHLRRKFGPEYRLGVSTPAAAVHALMRLQPGFRDALAAGEYRVRRGRFKTGVDLPAAGLGLRVAPGGEVHIIPVAKGGKRGGVGKTIIGAVLVVAAIVLVQPEVAGALMPELGVGAMGPVAFAGLATPLVGSFTIGGLALMGGAMMLGGILQMISPQPKAANNAQATQNYLLSGMANVTTQGVPVPVVYGRMRVGSVLVSIGYSAEEFSPNSTLMTPSGGGDAFAPFYGAGGTYVGYTPAGEQTQTIGTSGPIDAGEGSTNVTEDPSNYMENFNEGGAGGGGKGGGGSSGSAHEDPDTLHSKATIRIIDVISEGPVGGLVNGAQSIFFNDTPLQASDGSYNFKGVTWEFRYGYPDQDPVAGFPASETSISVGHEATKLAPVTQTITSTTATAARVTIRIPAMFKRDPNSGSITAAPELHYRIEVRPSQSGSPGWMGGWLTVTDVSIVGGKTMSPYQRSHRFDLPLDNGANTWDVRLTRLTDDSADITNLQNDIYFDLLDVIDDHRLMYPNTAYIALTIDAKAFGSTIPTRQYEVYGRSIPLPLNYDPSARTYANSGPGTSGGTWDLTSVHTLPSDNPAFLLLDMLTNTRYGCGVPSAYLEVVRADLYNIAQYCDASVPDGFGGTEPRYTVNGVISSQDDAYRLLQMMVSAFRGMTYWGSGQVMVTADMPESPVKLVNQANVEGGAFSYESTSQKTRHNLVRVAYVDRSNRYLPGYEMVADTADIAARGPMPTDIVAWGCVSRGLAHRLGKWLLYTENRQVETVSYRAGAYHTDLRPSDKILVSDPAYVGARYAGRIRPSTIGGGINLITNSAAPGPAPVAPNTVATSTAVAEQYHGATRYLHTYGHGASAICGSLSVSVPAGTYVASCWIWIPSAFTGTQVALSSDVAIAGSTYVLGTPFNSSIALPDGTLLGLITDQPATPIADLTKRDQWQRISFLVTYGAAATAVVRVTCASATTEAFYSTCWQLESTQLTPFAMTSGGVRQIRELYLDATYILDGSASHTISVVMPNGTVDADIPVDAFASAGASPDYTIVKTGRALALVPAPHAEWIVTSTNVQPRQFQVLALGEESRGVYSITAVNYDPNKFAEIELGLKFDPANYSTLPSLLVAPLPPPTNVSARDYMTGVGVTQTIRVTVSWTAPLDPRIASFQVMASADGFFQTWSLSWGTSYDIDNLPAGGAFTFGVRSVGSDGKTSEWALTTSATTVDGKVDPPAAPSGLAAVGGTRRVQVTWLPVANRRDIITYEVWRGNGALNGPGAGATLAGTSGGTQFVDSDSGALLPNTTWYYWVRGIAQGSPLVNGSFAGPVSATTTLLITDDLQNGIINTAKLASDIKPVRLITDLTATGTDGDIAYNATDGKLYWIWSGVWLPYIDFATIAGTVQDAQIAGMAASKLAGTISSTSIADGSISTPKLAAGAVQAGNIAAGAVQALSIASGAVTAGKVAANAITSTELAASAVTAGKVAAAAIGATEIAAAQIRATHLAADFVLASNAQFGNAVIRNAQIDQLAVGTRNIDSQTVTQTSVDYLISPLYFYNDFWTTVVSSTISVPTYGKVLIIVKSVTDEGATSVLGGNYGGNGGSEGNGGGDGE